MMEKPTTLKRKEPSRKKKPKASLLKRFNDWFHLWIGIAVGIPIVIISITGCLLVFEHEIVKMSRSWWEVEIPENAELLPPSKIRSKVVEQLPEMKIRRIWYYGQGKPVKISPDNSDSLIWANPYTGAVLTLEDHEDIFHFIEEGHVNLWLPPDVGHVVVSWCTVVFLALLITGLVLWWPKKWNKREAKQAFTIKWKAKFKRINYDLHNVLGFYSMFLVIIMVFTGLMMGFMAFRSTMLQLLGEKERERKDPVVIASGPKLVPETIEGKVDFIWKLVTTELAEKNKDEISIHFPKEDSKSIYTCTDMYHGTWRIINFDVNNLGILSSSEVKIEEDSPSGWMKRSNFSLHVGAFGGLLTKWLFFFASLICGTLPITGFYIWWGKRKKSGKKKKPVLNVAN